MDQEKINRIDQLRDQLRKQSEKGESDPKLQRELMALIEETGYAEEIELDYD